MNHTETVIVEGREHVLRFSCDWHEDAGTLISGTIDQFPDVEEFSDSYDFTKQLLIDTIKAYLEYTRSQDGN